MKQILNEREINQKLNRVEQCMLRALQNDPDQNTDRKWIRGHSRNHHYYLYGKKETNSAGEPRFSFEILKEAKALKPIGEEKMEEYSVTEEAKKLIKVKIVALEERIEESKRMKSALESVLSEDL